MIFVLEGNRVTRFFILAARLSVGKVLGSYSGEKNEGGGTGRPLGASDSSLLFMRALKSCVSALHYRRRLR